MEHQDFGRRRRPDMHSSAFDEMGGGGHRRGRRGGHGFGPMGPGFPGGPMGPGFPGFPGGPGFGPRGGGRRARRGDVRLAALLLIAEEPRNGYQIIQELESRTEGRWKPSPGAIYPALSQLEDEGLIRPVDAAAGKAYEITEAGTAEAERLAQQPAPWESPEGEERSPAHGLMHGFGQLGQAVGAVAQTGDEQAIAQATAELEALRRRIYQLLAES